jgi:hypothetical protein
MNGSAWAGRERREGPRVAEALEGLARLSLQVEYWTAFVAITDRAAVVAMGQIGYRVEIQAHIAI